MTADQHYHVDGAHDPGGPWADVRTADAPEALQARPEAVPAGIRAIAAAPPGWLLELRQPDEVEWRRIAAWAVLDDGEVVALVADGGHIRRASDLPGEAELIFEGGRRG